MLKVIKELDSWVDEIIKDDPVRPELPAEFRINESSEMFALWGDKNLGAVCCVTYTDGIPQSVEEMDWLRAELGNCAIFYTIWSYEKGCGRDLINKASAYIKSEYPQVQNIITLSPKTEMAEKFHIKNGAWKYRENTDTINYAYELDGRKN